MAKIQKPMSKTQRAHITTFKRRLWADRPVKKAKADPHAPSWWIGLDPQRFYREIHEREQAALQRIGVGNP